jgi:hypothetical protein
MPSGPRLRSGARTGRRRGTSRSIITASTVTGGVATVRPMSSAFMNQ